MKKLIAVFILVVLTLSLVGCSMTIASNSDEETSEVTDTKDAERQENKLIDLKDNEVLVVDGEFYKNYTTSYVKSYTCEHYRRTYNLDRYQEYRYSGECLDRTRGLYATNDRSLVSNDLGIVEDESVTKTGYYYRYFYNERFDIDYTITTLFDYTVNTTVEYKYLPLGNDHMSILLVEYITREYIYPDKETLKTYTVTNSVEFKNPLGYLQNITDTEFEELNPDYNMPRETNTYTFDYLESYTTKTAETRKINSYWYITE